MKHSYIHRVTTIEINFILVKQFYAKIEGDELNFNFITPKEILQ